LRPQTGGKTETQCEKNKERPFDAFFDQF